MRFHDQGPGDERVKIIPAKILDAVSDGQVAATQKPRGFVAGGILSVMTKRHRNEVRRKPTEREVRTFAWRLLLLKYELTRVVIDHLNRKVAR